MAGDAQDHIDRLDRSLAKNGEWVTLRRTAGSGASVQNVDVQCRAKIIPLSARLGDEKIIGNISATAVGVLMSMTQIKAAQWPGGTKPQSPPFNVDPRVPRLNDLVIVRGQLRRLAYVPPALTIDGEVVRIEFWAD